MIDLLVIRFLHLGLIFFGILLLLYVFFYENGSSSESNQPNSANSQVQKSPFIVRNKVSDI
jgi:hypothetical protein